MERRFTMHVDGRPETIAVRADMVLVRGGRRYVAEVKSGRIAPDPTSTATRRQLLEYAGAFDADGVLLFDMEAKRIRPVEFSTRRRGRAWPWLAAGLGLGWLVARADFGFLLAFLSQGL